MIMDKMETAKTIKIALPVSIGKELSEIARQEHQTVAEVLRESFRQYRARKSLYRLSEKTQKLVKQKGLTPEDFGGPFEE